jgi:hypothetical protein
MPEWVTGERYLSSNWRHLVCCGWEPAGRQQGTRTALHHDLGSGFNGFNIAAAAIEPARTHCAVVRSPDWPFPTLGNTRCLVLLGP